jgi:hypothetical protein
MSALALIISAATAYFTNFRISDDIRVAFSSSPFVTIDEKGQSSP